MRSPGPSPAVALGADLGEVTRGGRLWAPRRTREVRRGTVAPVPEAPLASGAAGRARSATRRRRHRSSCVMITACSTAMASVSPSPENATPPCLAVCGVVRRGSK